MMLLDRSPYIELHGSKRQLQENEVYQAPGHDCDKPCKEAWVVPRCVSLSESHQMREGTLHLIEGGSLIICIQ